MYLVNALLAPLFLHLLLITIVGTRNLLGRIQSVRSGETKLSNIALSSAAWPERLRKLGNNFDNQFDIPWLWYSVCAFMIITSKVDVFAVILSWGFLVSRVAHSYIHTGSNVIRYRMYSYLLGFILVFLMWVWFGLRLYVIG